MSYCRFSSDDYRCDAYVYEGTDGMFHIHLAMKRHSENTPRVPPYGTVSDEDFSKAFAEQREFLRQSDELEDIEIEGAGESFSCESPGDCAEMLKEFKGRGFRIPDDVIDALEDEEREDMMKNKVPDSYYTHYKDADTFIQEYIISQDLNAHNFVTSPPYEKDGKIGLDISDNNMMQDFALIGNATLEEVKERICDYFK